MSTFGSVSTATRFRDVVQSIVRRTLARERPADAYGIVQTIDHTNRKCTVLLAGSTSSVTVSMGTIRPSAIGQTVRISGAAQDRYVADVVMNSPRLEAGEFNVANPPWALGQLNSTILTSNSAAFTSIIYPLQTTATTLANRKLRVRVHANVQSATVNASVSLSVCNSAGTILNQAYRICSLANAAEQLSCEWEGTSGTGGAMTFRLGVYANVSSLIPAAATAFTMITVFDEGPA